MHCWLPSSYTRFGEQVAYERSDLEGVDIFDVDVTGLVLPLPLPLPPPPCAFTLAFTLFPTQEPRLLLKSAKAA
jgi:hypothetical protein